MLSRQNRFSLKTDRFRIEKEGKTIHSPLFTYLISPRENHSDPLRFAILVSKKSLPLSVTRHALKRRLTEVIRHHLESFPTGKDIILIPKKNTFSATPDQILSDLQHILNF